MSKKLVSIIFLGICLLLVGCGKEVVDSKYTGKWKLESSGIGMSDGSNYKETDAAGKVSLDLDIDAEGNVKELYIDDAVAITNSYKLKKKGDDEYQYDGTLISKKVYSYETESDKENVETMLKFLKSKDNVKITKNEQKGDEYHIEVKADEKDFVFSLEMQSRKLIFKKVDTKEKVLIKETYKKN
ncbi:TPA_asm: hypothetical protein GZK48_13430 [Listeria monocytogenes]|uniref:Lipoprotein n=2 Tax=Listeria monocytogenes TaxID=1639 RepID=A0A3T2CTD3_LISMN|nr:hypothetical protein [Listeria monocytogenes]EAE6068280.1 hypothetical protein [Listeria monocytogenes serotype 1/2a]AEO02381.1 putative secreted protein [Listeria monocytogenes J0161]AQP63993.1 hypothetical protein B0X19_01675 [Listeria monocytogenes]EAA0273426.1 hypothetical protein [Listeria monocytogenes]EAC2909621.1 hypothetical protein [Listeria monocytogenes]